MKQTLLLIGGLLILNTVQAQTASVISPQLSPLTMQYLEAAGQNRTGSILPDYIYKRRMDNTVCLSALVKVTNGFSEERMKNLDVSVGTKAGNIWTVLVPITQMQAFSVLKGIEYIELDEPVAPALDLVRVKTHADSVQKGINLPMPYTGKGVIMGVIDFGFDYNHPVLYDTLGTAYRLRKVWQLNSTGTPPSGYAYGKEITDSNAIRAEGTDNSLQTHGTGTSGIAAGSGFGSPTQGKYRGLAYDAEMVFVGVRRDSIETQWRTGGFSDFVDGIKYIYDYAASVGKPAVVNISWGSQSGPHDGSSLFNQACNNLTGAGKLLVMSAGNEGQENIHLTKTFTATDTVINTFLDFTDNSYKRTWVDIWGEPGKTFCGKVTLYNGSAAGQSVNLCVTGTSGSYYLVSSNGLDTCFIKYYPYTASYNNKPRLTIDIYNKSADDVNVSVAGNSGLVNIWNEYYYYGYKFHYASDFVNKGFQWATAGNTATTVSDMGSAQSVLLIGAYVNRTSWKNINNITYSYGSGAINNIAPFSSRGPMIDGRIKPDIVAPGQGIATSISSFDTSYTEVGSNSGSTVSAYQSGSNKKYYFSMFSGTSASAPVASGIVALMLQAKPSLTPTECTSIIQQTALNDVYTQQVLNNPSNIWGTGKINAYAAVKKTIQVAGVKEVVNQLDCQLFPNPNEGNFILSYEGKTNDNLKINILNMSGQVVGNSLWSVKSGANTHSVAVANYVSGMYFVQITGKQGKTIIKMTIR